MMLDAFKLVRVRNRHDFVEHALPFICAVVHRAFPSGFLRDFRERSGGVEVSEVVGSIHRMLFAANVVSGHCPFYGLLPPARLRNGDSLFVRIHNSVG